MRARRESVACLGPWLPYIVYAGVMVAIPLLRGVKPGAAFCEHAVVTLGVPLGLILVAAGLRAVLRPRRGPAGTSP